MTVQSSARPMDGRVAVVTGASSGIGAAVAEHLAWLGAKVAVIARREGRLEDLVNRIEKNGGGAMEVAADVTDAAGTQDAADAVEAALGPADLLVNNAGVMLPAPVEERRTDQWRREIDLNITGLMNTIGAFLPQLVRAAGERGVADLINTASIAAHNIFPNFAVYSGTKAFVVQLSRDLRVELGPKHVRVAAISPGIVETELQDHVTDAGAREWLEGARQTLEWLAPQDIAQIVGFMTTLPPRANLQEVIVMPTGQPA